MNSAVNPCVMLYILTLYSLHFLELFIMENIALSIVLFLAVLSLEAALFGNPQSVSAAKNVNLSNANTNTPSAVTPQLPTASTPKVYVEDVFSLLDDTPDSIDTFVNSLNYRNARKVAKHLNIKQSVTNNGKKKDKSASFLKREIKQKLRASTDTNYVNSIVSTDYNAS